MSNSWHQEEEVEIGMWSNSQQDNRSHDQNTWNYKHKGSNKVCHLGFAHLFIPKIDSHFNQTLADIKGKQFNVKFVLVLSAVFQMNKPVNKQDEHWMKPFINQFNSMNFSVSTDPHYLLVIFKRLSCSVVYKAFMKNVYWKQKQTILSRQ